MTLDALPATADRETLREAIDALRHSSRGMALLVLQVPITLGHIASTSRKAGA